MPFESIVSAFVTLLVVVDPAGLAPIFLSVTQGMPGGTRRRVAISASTIAGAVLAGFALIGSWLLAQLGITLPAFRIAGGLLLFAIAFEMVYGQRSDRQTKTAEQAQGEHAHHVAAFPLAIPLLAGPGAITATLLLAGQTAGQPTRLAALLAIIAAVSGLCIVVFCFAARMGRLLGTTGNLVLSRLLGIVLTALAVQFVIDGVAAVMRP
jgi:multiple antibiotic resistance protein